MTLITIAPGVRVLRRHPDRDVLIVEGLGEYATLFIESIPGGWCVVNGEAATKRIYEQVRQCEKGGMEEQKFNEMGQQDVPDLLLEVRRLQADNRRLSDNLKHVFTALGEHLRPGQTPERAIKRIVVDLAVCVKERDDGQHEINLFRDALEDAYLTLAAEQGKAEGAPTGWRWQVAERKQGCRREWLTGRWIKPHSEGGMLAAHLEYLGPGAWRWSTPRNDRAKGEEPTARAAMLAADKALFESPRRMPRQSPPTTGQRRDPLPAERHPPTNASDHD